MTSDECEATGRNRPAKVLELHWRTGHSEFSSLLLTTTTREHGHLEKDTASFRLSGYNRMHSGNRQNTFDVPRANVAGNRVGTGLDTELRNLSHAHRGAAELTVLE